MVVEEDIPILNIIILQKLSPKLVGYLNILSCTICTL